MGGHRNRPIQQPGTLDHHYETIRHEVGALLKELGIAA
jgi:hypothetical protein